MEKYVDVYTASDITFAYLVKAQLEDAGISVQIANDNVSTGILCADGMAPRVQVPANREEEARKILEEIREASATADDDLEEEEES